MPEINSTDGDLTPSYVIHCKELLPGAKAIYQEIVSLIHKNGYCDATDRYFSQLYNIDISTVQSWLRSLKNKKLIVTEVRKIGYKCQRKIWILDQK